MAKTRKKIALILIFSCLFLSPVFTFPQEEVSSDVYTSQSLGFHDIAEFSGCNNVILSDCAKLEKILIQAAHIAGAQRIGHITCQTAEGINSCIVLVSESHLSIHAFPLLGYAAVDVFTCGECDNKKAIDYIEKHLQSESNNHKKITRGIFKQEVLRTQDN